MEKISFNESMSYAQWAIIKALADCTDIDSDENGCLEVELKINGRVFSFKPVIDAMVKRVAELQLHEAQKILEQRSLRLSQVLEQMSYAAQDLSTEFNARVSGLFDK